MNTVIVQFNIINSFVFVSQIVSNTNGAYLLKKIVDCRYSARSHFSMAMITMINLLRLQRYSVCSSYSHILCSVDSLVAFDIACNCHISFAISYLSDRLTDLTI
jgi:hypothetical protein